MATASEIMLRGLRMLNVKASGESLSASEVADGLMVLNNLIESLSNEPDMLYGMTQVSHTLVASTGSYTIGATGTIATAQPVRIESAFIRDSSGNDFPMDIINSEQYSRVLLKTNEATYPRYIYHNRQWPDGTLYLYPEPVAAVTMILNYWPQITQFAAGSTTSALPPGYDRMLEYGFAIEMAPEFRIDNVQFLQVKFDDAKMRIKIANGTETPVLRSGVLGGGAYSVRSDSYE